MVTGPALTERLKVEFTVPQAELLSWTISEAYDNLVKTSDFNELKEIVRDLGESQKNAEQRMDELAEAQKNTENAMAKMAEAMVTMRRELHDEIKATRLELKQDIKETRDELKGDIKETRSQLAGLSKSFGYALENEAYRMLPAFLEKEHGITVERRFIREYISEHEVNLFSEGQQNGEPILIVGESKARLSTNDFKQLYKNVDAVRQAQEEGTLPDYRILPIFITHMARPQAVRAAKEEGIVIVHSFEW